MAVGEVRILEVVEGVRLEVALVVCRRVRRSRRTSRSIPGPY